MTCVAYYGEAELGPEERIFLAVAPSKHAYVRGRRCIGLNRSMLRLYMW